MKLIAEPWDVGEGGYQIGRLPGAVVRVERPVPGPVRDFWRGGEGDPPTDSPTASPAAPTSSRPPAAGPSASINFVTAHDGFTLRDLVSYNQKHNEANGEDNRDGTDDNRSWNCGVEGPTDDPAINALRARQQRNFLATLCLSQGIPMLVRRRRDGPHPGGQQQRLLPRTTRSPGSTGRRPTRISSPSPPG